MCSESRHEALKAYTIRFEALKNPGIIYLNPLLDTVYLNSNVPPYFKILLSDIQAFDLEEEQGLRHYAISGDMDILYLADDASIEAFEGLDTLTVVYDGAADGRWSRERRRWIQEAGRECAFAAPEMSYELRFWEERGRKMEYYMNLWMAGRKYPPDVRVTAIRRGSMAKSMCEEDKAAFVLEGPRRPNGNYDPGYIIPSWE